MSQVWVVRVNDSIEHQEYALREGCVVVGFDMGGSLDELNTREKAFNAATREGMSNQKIATRAYQPYHFAHTIQDGDYVVMPRRKRDGMRSVRTSYCAIGKFSGGYRYVENAGEGYKHQRGVEWKGEDVSVGLLPHTAPLSSHMTVFKLSDTSLDDLENAIRNAAQDIATFSANAISFDFAESDFSIESNTPTESADSVVDSVEQFDRSPNVKQYIKVNFPGNYLCEVVSEILTAMGYDCESMGSGPDRGVDIIASHRELVDTIFVQVKNTGGQQGSPNLDKFSGAVLKVGHAGSKGLFVSWGGFGSDDNENKLKAQYRHIRFWDAEKVVSLVEKYYDDFHDDFKRNKLPLEKVWVLNLGSDFANNAEA